MIVSSFNRGSVTRSTCINAAMPSQYTGDWQWASAAPQIIKPYRVPKTEKQKFEGKKAYNSNLNHTLRL